ncbi:hypothetical protein CCHR01_07728 [Colletotrichum chrysophilum]|uniref:DUF6536 domain-containing protein n=1 Tax=Colletotrichum chrysophilum TaxID=1836956 RepID=A0AAD9AKK4_9PEZI|nr:hypothetical protein CCHR01_07728 [Colletotrichum chrysophilum]
MKLSIESPFSEGLVPRDLWRRGALSFAAAALFTFIVNFSFTIWTMTQDAPDGVGLIWEGEQTIVKAWNTAMHIVINIISTILLAGSNYCMQCLMAPTRSELDKAHSEKRWLDVGIPTIRNFRSITLRRKVLWVLLSISSFPLHLLFNSVIFASISTNEYSVFVVSEQSVPGRDSTSLPDTLDTGLLPRTRYLYSFPNATFEYRDPTACLEDYGTAFQSKRGSLVLVTNSTGINVTFVQYGAAGAYVGGVSGSFNWLCKDDTPCDEKVVNMKEGSIPWKPLGLDVRGCYNKETFEHSKLFFSRAICWVVTILNLAKAILMLFVAYDGVGNTEQPILTVGDAVASYIQIPDWHTRKMCLKSKKCFSKENWEPSPKHFDPTRHRKFSGGSISRWVVCVSLVCGGLLLFGLADLREQISPAPVSLEKYGPGVVHSDTIMKVFNPERNVLILSVILANIPQVLMSLIYFNYNALFTCISLAAEWDRFFGGKKKGLRVSTWPQGHQRQTYFLQLPYRYSLALAAFSGGLHWLISQSIFLIRVESYNDYDKFSDENTSSGWSPIGIILVMVAGAVLIAFLVTSGYFRLRYGGIPVVGSCSAAIAAACHADPSERDSLATLPLTWGVVSGKDVEPGHCSFTSKDAEKPVEGCVYE